ncbi:MAG: acyl-CoA dehydrogenase, partial [Gammaproteobacteria bacterium]
MLNYIAPQRDLKFVMQELLNCEQHYENLSYGDASIDMLDAILLEAGKFSEQVLAPLNQSGDAEGCTWDNGKVTTPKGFKVAYNQFVEDGWPTLSQSLEFGGQGLPASLSFVISEMLSSTNQSFSMYQGLGHGALATIENHGTELQKQKYMPNLVSGKWSGTMCLTESHCGSDLGLLRTKAELNSDFSYSLTGTKIFISAGEHDLTDNIIHMVIARIEGAPAGSKGISLFIVPKININDDGTLGENNSVSCGSIEHKMGINANATCVMNFEGAKGFLIGSENRGLNSMFTFINNSRIAVAYQGVAAAESSFQGSLSYAKERLQMRSLTGVKNPNGAADPIIVHPDVRRMLLTQKSI